MEYLQNGYSLNIAPDTFPLSTDSILLSDFIKLPKQAKVLDLGSGCGTLGLLLCAKDAACSVTGIEINSAAHNAAEENIQRNALQDRLFSVCADLRSIPDHFPAGSFHCCVSNPPYFTGGPASKTAPQARRDDNCSIKELFAAAAWAVRYGGDFYLVHKPERLAELVVSAANVKLEPKRLCLLRHRPDGPVALVLLQLRKGAKPGLVWEEIVLKDTDGNPSEDYKRIYHQT